MDWYCAIRSAKINLMREMIPELTVEEVRFTQHNPPNNQLPLIVFILIGVVVCSCVSLINYKMFSLLAHQLCRTTY